MTQTLRDFLQKQHESAHNFSKLLNLYPNLLSSVFPNLPLPEDTTFDLKSSENRMESGVISWQKRIDLSFRTLVDW